MAVTIDKPGTGGSGPGDARAAATHEVDESVTVLYQAAKARIKSLAARFDPDLGPLGFGILRYILATQPLRSGDIVTALGMDKGAVSRQVGLLRDMGLIETRPDPDDGRASILVPSTTAREALEAFRAESTAGYDRVLADWSTEDIATFAALLHRFNESVTSNSPL